MGVEKSINGELSVEVLISYQGIILSTAIKYLGKQYACWAQDVAQVKFKYEGLIKLY